MTNTATTNLVIKVTANAGSAIQALKDLEAKAAGAAAGLQKQTARAILAEQAKATAARRVMLVNQAEFEHKQGLKSGAEVKEVLAAELAQYERFSAQWTAITRKISQIDLKESRVSKSAERQSERTESDARRAVKDAQNDAFRTAQVEEAKQRKLDSLTQKGEETRRATRVAAAQAEYRMGIKSAEDTQATLSKELREYEDFSVKWENISRKISAVDAEENRRRVQGSQASGRRLLERGTRLGMIGAGIGQTGQAMTQGYTQPVAQALGFAVKTAVAREDQFADVEKVYPKESAANIAETRKQLEALTRILPLTFEEITKLANSGGQLGVPIQALGEFTKVSAQLGLVTDLSSEQATMGLSKIAAAMGLNISDGPEAAKTFHGLAEQLTQMGIEGSATGSEIIRTAQRIASAGKNAGMTAGDVLALSNGLASLGQRAEAGGTAALRTINKMTVAVAVGGKHLAQYANVAGMTSAQFKASFEKDALGTLLKFTAGLDRLQKSGHASAAVLTEMGIKGANEMIALENLSHAQGMVIEYRKHNNEALRSGTILEEASAKKTKDAASQYKILTNAFEETAGKLGSKLIPVLVKLEPDLEKLLVLASKLIDDFDALPQPAKEAALGLLAVSLAAGPVIQTVGGVISIVGGMARAFGAFKLLRAGATLAEVTGGAEAAEGATTAFATEGGASLFAAAGPWGLAIGALVLIIGGIALAWKKAGDAQDSYLKKKHDDVNTPDVRTNIKNQVVQSEDQIKKEQAGADFRRKELADYKSGKINAEALRFDDHKGYGTKAQNIARIQAEIDTRDKHIAGMKHDVNEMQKDNASMSNVRNARESLGLAIKASAKEEATNAEKLKALTHLKAQLLSVPRRHGETDSVYLNTPANLTRDKFNDRYKENVGLDPDAVQARINELETRTKTLAKDRVHNASEVVRYQKIESTEQRNAKKGEGGSAGYVQAMMHDAGHYIGLECGEAITYYLKKKGINTTATAADTAANRVHPDAQGNYPEGTIFRVGAHFHNSKLPKSYWQSGKEKYSQGHYEMLHYGPGGKPTTVEANIGIRKGVTDTRPFDVQAEAREATWGGAVHAYLPTAAMARTWNKNHIAPKGSTAAGAEENDSPSAAAGSGAAFNPALFSSDPKADKEAARAAEDLKNQQQQARQIVAESAIKDAQFIYQRLLKALNDNGADMTAAERSGAVKRLRAQASTVLALQNSAAKVYLAGGGGGGPTAQAQYDSSVKDNARSHSGELKVIQDAAESAKDAAEKKYRESKRKQIGAEKTQQEDQLRNLEIDKKLATTDAARALIADKIYQKNLDIALTQKHLDQNAEDHETRQSAPTNYAYKMRDIDATHTLDEKENRNAVRERAIALLQAQADATDDLVAKNALLYESEEKQKQMATPDELPKVNFDIEAARDKRAIGIGEEGANKGLMQALYAPTHAVAAQGLSDYTVDNRLADGRRKPEELGKSSQRQVQELLDAAGAAKEDNPDKPTIGFADIAPLVGPLLTQAKSSGDVKSVAEIQKEFIEFYKTVNKTALDDAESNPRKRNKDFANLETLLQASAKAGNLPPELAGLIHGFLAETKKKDNKQKPDKENWDSYRRDMTKSIGESASEASKTLFTKLLGGGKDKKAAFKEFWGSLAESGKTTLIKMFQDRVINRAFTSIFDGIGDKVGAALKGGGSGLVQSGMQFALIIGAAMNLTSSNKKKRNHSIFGAVLGGVAGSFFGGVGAFKGAEIGANLGGMFAEGGRPPMGKVSIVGERGIELFRPDVPGTIIPNHKISDFLTASSYAPGAVPGQNSSPSVQGMNTQKATGNMSGESRTGRSAPMIHMISNHYGDVHGNVDVEMINQNLTDKLTDKIRM